MGSEGDVSGVGGVVGRLVSYYTDYKHRVGVEINVYPNPNAGRFVVDFPIAEGKTATLSLYDLTGRQLFRKTITQRR